MERGVMMRLLRMLCGLWVCCLGLRNAAALKKAAEAARRNAESEAQRRAREEKERRLAELLDSAEALIDVGQYVQGPEECG